MAADVVERTYVWAGGASFVLSLTLCAYSYLVLWSSGEPALPQVLHRWQQPSAGPVGAAAIDGLLFALFAAHHSLFAREPVKQRLARAIPERLLRPTYVLTSSLLLSAVCLLWQPIGGDLYREAGWRVAAHASIQLFGVWLIWRSVGAIDALELAGIRRRSSSDRLQMAGPYRVVRHPLYSGWLLVVFGAAHMTGDRLAFAAFTAAYLLVAIPWEERALAETFGADYQAYERRVRWRLVPYVY